jgi:hypothetical protein
MIFILAITVIFLLLTIYLFFRAEKLQQQLVKAKSESHNVRKENKALLDSLMLVSTRQEELVKNRFQTLKDSHKENDHSAHYAELKIIAPLINNYAAIFRACLKGKGQLSTITKKCYDNSEPDSYKEFTQWVNKQDKKLKRMWTSNTLSGYLALVEAILLQQSAQLSKEPIAKAS